MVISAKRVAKRLYDNEYRGLVFKRYHQEDESEMGMIAKSTDRPEICKTMDTLAFLKSPPKTSHDFSLDMLPDYEEFMAGREAHLQLSLPTISSILSFLWRLTPALPKRLFKLSHEQYDPETLLHIRWSGHRYLIDFEGRILGQVQLKELREICKDLTGVPLGGLSLSHAGATMKDDNAPLSCFGIKAGTKIIVHGVKPTAEQIKELTTNGDPEEYALILRIANSLQKSKDFVSEHQSKYEAEVETYLASKPAPFVMSAMPPARKKLHDYHGMMSELLLQALLGLDGVTCKPDFEVARVKRREAVKETQRLLDTMDAIHARVKESDRLARL
ncbi:hypothetical protein BGX29_005221 [Mortierella sp. GBA35]|nr:hypothetical protein BGX29_005221 [Mortierella sp. GBA35]